MDEFLPGEIRAVRDELVRFLEREIIPELVGYESRGEFPRPLIAKMGEAGYYGVAFPERLGGTDLGFLAMAVVAEEVARANPALSLSHNQQGMTCPYTIYSGGSDGQCEQYIPDIIAGKTIGLWSLTESGGGSDAAGNLKTFARRDGDRYLLNGSKMFATLADQTDVGVLFARTDKEARPPGYFRLYCRAQ